MDDCSSMGNNEESNSKLEDNVTDDKESYGIREDEDD